VSEPDLFVVCKNCGSEVSPYVTECPYCGQRVRKRAPRIDRGGEPSEPRRRRLRGRSLPRFRPGEIPGIAPETRPYATGLLIVISLLATIVWQTQEFSARELGALCGADCDEAGAFADEWWRVATTPFIHENLGYQFVTLFTVGLFGMHLERRFNFLVPVVLFVGGGAAGAALSRVTEIYPAQGANGAALAMLIAWLVNDRMAFRRGDDRENDLIGVYVIAGALLLMPLADTEASEAAAAGGALFGALMGLLLSGSRRR
jgi:membrane associated rhomboid family serine protease